MSSHTPQLPAIASGGPVSLPGAENSDPQLLEGEALKDESALANLNRVLQEIGEESVGSSKVQIWRITREFPKTGIYLDEMTPGQFSVSRLKDEHGGGTYNIKVYVPRVDEGGNFLGLSLKANPRITIGGAPKLPREDVPTVVSSPASGDVNALAVAMQAGFSQMADILKSALNKPERTTKQLLEEMALMKTLFADKPAPVQDQFAQFERFLETQTKLQALTAGGGNGEGMSTASVMVLAKEFLTAFRGISPQQIQQQQPEQVPTNDPVPVIEHTHAPVQHEVNNDEGDPVDLIYKGYVARLIQNAERNVNPTEIAQNIYDLIDDEFQKALFEMPDYMEMLAKYNPRVRLHRVWFDKVMAELKRIASDDQQQNP